MQWYRIVDWFADYFDAIIVGLLLLLGAFVLGFLMGLTFNKPPTQVVIPDGKFHYPTPEVTVTHEN